MIYQVINVSVITIRKERGQQIILGRETLYHSSIKSNVGSRILKSIAETTLKSKREKI